MGNLAASFNWNSGSTVITDDYAGNGAVSEGMTDITIGNGVVGNTAIFNGNTSLIRFGPILDLVGLDNITCMVQIKRASSKVQFIFQRGRQIEVSLQATNEVVFSLAIDGSTETLISSGTIDTSSRTIECVYNGVNMFIYIDGQFDSSKAVTGLIDAFTEDFLIGAREFMAVLANFFDGEIEVLDCRTDALIADQVAAWHDNPLGTEYEFQGVHKLELGDIVGGGKLFEFPLPEIIGVISFVVDTSILRIKPVINQFNLNDVPVRRGNIIDDSRQWLAEYQIIGNQPFFQIRDRIKTVAAGDPSVEASKGVLLTRDASIFKNAIIPDFVIDPSPTTGSIDDLAPVDIEFCNTLYLSATSASSWTGLKQPVPLRPQFMFVINRGTRNITARNNSASSIEVNRFLINGNVIFNPEDCGFAIYDVVRLRWRINKI